MIRFNDIYEEADAELLDSLPHELSTLGLELERRFEVEDRMIALLHGGKAPA
jgi:regulator of sigma D